MLDDSDYEPFGPLAEADSRFRSGDAGAGRRAVHELLDRHPEDDDLHEQAMVLLAEAGFLLDAEELARAIERRFGYTPHESLAEARDAAARAADGGMRFRRTRRSRHGLGGTWAPIKRRGKVTAVDLRPEALVVEAVGGGHRLLWSAVRGVRLERRRAYAYDEGGLRPFEERVLVIPGPAGALRVDVSSYRAEFDRPLQLERDLRARVPVELVELEPVDKRAFQLRRNTIALGCVAAASGIILLLGQL